MNELSEPQRQALLRFAQEQAKEIAAQDDTQIYVLHLAMLLLFESDPKRIAPLLAAARATYEGTKVVIKT